jgi:hypothetical protein
MPDGVDTTVDGMQPADLGPVLDRPAPEPELEQLEAGHNTVLPGRQPGDREIHAGSSPKSGDKPARVVHAARLTDKTLWITTSSQRNSPDTLRVAA